MSDETNADEYLYPPAWTPPGMETPRPPDYAPKPKTGVYGYTGDEQPEDPDAYPKTWRRS
jgi:hypothetical protein